MFFKTSLLKNFVNFTGEHLCWSLFLIKLQSCNLIKIILQRRCFPAKFTKFFKNTLFTKHLRWLLQENWYLIEANFIVIAVIAKIIVSYSHLQNPNYSNIPLCSKKTMRVKSSHWRCSVKKVALKNFLTFTGKHMYWIFFLINLQASSTGVFLWILRNF